jgi:hypothetical protein
MAWLDTLAQHTHTPTPHHAARGTAHMQNNTRAHGAQTYYIEYSYRSITVYKNIRHTHRTGQEK